jgi:hypothetical protein
MSTASMTFGRTAPLTAHPSRFLAQCVGSAWGFVQSAERRMRSSRDESMTSSQVLAWAQRIENSDPGFAADLRGAAMRAND